MKTLEQKIMSRVRRIYYLRKLTGPTAFKAYALSILALWLSSLVSLANVFTNMPSPTDPGLFARFFMYATLHTDLAVQTILVGLTVLIAFMIRDVVQGIRANKRTSFAHI